MDERTNRLIRELRAARPLVPAAYDAPAAGQRGAGADMLPHPFVAAADVDVATGTVSCHPATDAWVADETVTVAVRVQHWTGQRPDVRSGERLYAHLDASGAWIAESAAVEQWYLAVVLDATTLPTPEAERVIDGAPHIDVVWPDGTPMTPGPTRTAAGAYVAATVAPTLPGWQVGTTEGSPWQLTAYHATSYAGPQIVVHRDSDQAFSSTTAAHVLAATLAASHVAGASNQLDATINYATGDLAGQVILLGGGPLVMAAADAFLPAASSGDVTRVVWSGFGWAELLHRAVVRSLSSGNPPAGHIRVGLYDGQPVAVADALVAPDATALCPVGTVDAGTVAHLPTVAGLPDPVPTLVDANGRSYSFDAYGRLSAVVDP